MSIWSDAPKREDLPANYRIMRCPPKGEIRGVVASDVIVGTHLHYFRGRSTPCSKSQCEACEAGHVPRWKGYVLLMSLKTKNLQIFEFTERAYEAFLQKQEQHASLRGCVLTCRRTANRPNGPLQATFDEARYDDALIPPVPDLREILQRIWEVKQQPLPLERDYTLTIDGEQRDDIPSQKKFA
jgi:hypothetical protein